MSPVLQKMVTVGLTLRVFGLPLFCPGTGLFPGLCFIPVYSCPKHWLLVLFFFLFFIFLIFLGCSLEITGEFGKKFLQW